jgi:hypothetical protein
MQRRTSVVIQNMVTGALGAPLFGYARSPGRLDDPGGVRNSPMPACATWTVIRLCEGSIKGRCECRVPVREIIPSQCLPETAALDREPEPFVIERHDIGATLDRDFAS